MKLFVATHNTHKLREIAAILPDVTVEADDPTGVEESAPDFAGNARIKVRAIAARHPGEWCMADDSGLEVKALGGAPGVRSARYAGEPSDTPRNNALLLKNLADINDRAARFTCAIALVDPQGGERIVVGHCPGTVARAPRGADGFGYDPLFIPEGETRSFAELTPDEKNTISHRARALAQAVRIIANGSCDSFPIPLARPLVVFDIESTGVSPRKDRIIELAAVRVNPDGQEESRCWLLNPTIPIPPETTEIHGITDDIVRDCPTFSDKAREIFDFFEGCDLSGYNADRFDIPCLEEEFARCGMNFAAAQRRHVDVQRIYHRMEPRDLSAAVKFFLGRDHAGAHGAEADTRATLDVLKAQFGRYPALPKSVDELDEWIAPHDPLNADRGGLFRWKSGEWIVNFGKKRGESLKHIMLDEPNFLKWMVKGDFDADARMIASDALDGRLPPPPKLTTSAS